MKYSDIVWDLELKFGAYCLDVEAERRAVAEYILQEIALAYEEGYEKGLEVGLDDGYDDGYSEGYKAGHAEGYSEGCSEERVT
ncbi:MAG: hypothetical protein MN733_41630 [Nitrososphaera sp.]|nr:hypothetical protein [Nitrososphaera sp.]